MSAPGRSGYDEAMLTQVINATDEAIGRMEAENNVVQGISSELPVVNQSRAGQRLSDATSEWSQAYYAIIQALRQLNSRASGLRGANAGFVDDATAAAR